MVGIGGCGMHALAEVLHRTGARVTGSDRQDGKAIARLTGLGIDVRVGENGAQLPADTDLVVASAAVPATDPELTAASRGGIRILKYAELLGRVMRDYIGVGIAGTHGKSTTTAMVSFILDQAGLDPTFVIGAGVPQLGGAARVGAGRFFVAEACEYDRSFHRLVPKLAAVLNIQEDHLDCYADLAEIIESFGVFARQVGEDGLIVASGEDANVAAALAGVERTVETFGLTPECAWRGEQVRLTGGTYAFDAWHGDSRLGACHLRIPGRYNVRNALAALALSHRCGVEPPTALAALSAFAGADRRQTVKATIDGVTVMDDYAHHPTEVRVTLRAVREFYQPKRVWCVFQPHQHSRTLLLLDDFAESFADADVVVVPKIYFVRDSQRWRHEVCAQDLVDRLRQRGVEAIHLAGFDRIARHLVDGVVPGDLVVTMGAGDVWKISDDVVRGLRGNR